MNSILFGNLNLVQDLKKKFNHKMVLYMDGRRPPSH